MEKFESLICRMKTIESERRKLIDKMEQLESENENSSLDTNIWNLEIKIDDLDKMYEELRNERDCAFRELYNDKTNTEFHMLESYRDIKNLRYYLQRENSKFSLSDFGIFDACELAEIIKYIYQFEQGGKYSILTLGADSMDGEPTNSEKKFASNPHVYFLIGNDDTLKLFLNSAGKFYNDNYLYNKLYMDAPSGCFSSIELKHNPNNTMKINCLTGSDFDEEGMINYFDTATQSYANFGIDKYKQIFLDTVIRKMNTKKSLGISPILDFDTPYRVINILVSIVIYKRNKGIKNLTEEDYNYIFDILYGKQVHIKEDIEKDIKRELIYVPNEITKR